MLLTREQIEARIPTFWDALQQLKQKPDGGYKAYHIREGGQDDTFILEMAVFDTQGNLIFAPACEVSGSVIEKFHTDNAPDENATHLEGCDTSYQPLSIMPIIHEEYRKQVEKEKEAGTWCPRLPEKCGCER